MSEPDFDTTQMPDGKTNVSSRIRVVITDGSLPSDDSIRDVAVLAASATPPRLKIKACEHFLSRIREYIHNEAAALYYVEAFAQSLRSSTFTLQKVCARVPGFAEWYETKQAQLRQNRLMRALVELRNASEKEGLSFSRYGSGVIFRQHRDGRHDVQLALPRIAVLGHQIPDPLPAFESALGLMSGIVEEVHQLGFVPVPDNRSIPLTAEFVREREDGTWEHYDP